MTPPAPTAPHHGPKACSCGAEILWVQLLDDQGRRVKHESGRVKSMPVDYLPTPDGNVQVFHRPGEGIVGRVFRDASRAPAGAILRRAHWADCPNAPHHRRKK